MAKSKGLYLRGKTWWIRYSGLDGRIRRESTGKKKKSEAEYVLACRRKEIGEGKEPEVKRIKNHTFMELSSYYKTWAERQRCYAVSKKYLIEGLEKEYGQCMLRRFSTMMVEQFQTKILNEGKAPATANRYLATIKHMFRKAVEWELVEEEILKKVGRVKHLPENNRRLRYLSQEECQELVNACADHLRPIVITALNTGMRKGEILSLEWDNHIDLKHGFILLDKTKNGDRREVPINATLSETLKGIVRRLDSPYVFIDSKGKRFLDIKGSWKSALRRTGIKNFRFHDLRHTFASQLVMAGVDITTIKELLGHKTLNMTLRYAHLAPSHKVNAVGVLDSVLNVSAHLLHNSNKKGVIQNG